MLYLSLFILVALIATALSQTKSHLSETSDDTPYTEWDEQHQYRYVLTCCGNIH